MKRGQPMFQSHGVHLSEIQRSQRIGRSLHFRLHVLQCITFEIMARWRLRLPPPDHGMARPGEFDETAVLDAAAQCFWAHGYEATSIRDLIAKTGVTGATLYNAFGDQRALYQEPLDYYVDRSA